MSVEGGPSGPNRGRLVAGLRMLRDAALLMIIASLIMGLGMTISMFGMWTVGPMMHGLSPGVPFFVGMGMIVLALIGIVGAIIGLYAVFGRLLPATTEFASYSSEYATIATLVKIGYVGGLVLLILGFITLMFFVGIFLMFAAILLLLIGSVGLALLSLKLHGELDSSAFLIAGILFLIGILVPIVRFIAWIIVYVEAGTLAGKLSASA